MSRVRQLKYVRTNMSVMCSNTIKFKSKRRIELLIYNPFQEMIPYKSLRLAVRDVQWLYFSLYKQLKKRNALLVCN